MKSKLLIGFLASASLFSAGLFINHSVSASPPSSPMPSRQASGYEISFGLANKDNKPSHTIDAMLDDDGTLFVSITRPGRLMHNDQYYLNEAMKQLPSWIDELVNHVRITFFDPNTYEFDLIPPVEYIALDLPVQNVLQMLS